jgi:hypothetical protein
MARPGKTNHVSLEVLFLLPLEPLEVLEHASAGVLYIFVRDDNSLLHLACDERALPKPAADLRS